MDHTGVCRTMTRTAEGPSPLRASALHCAALALLLAAAPLLAACSPNAGLNADDHRAIAALLDGQREAWNRGDLDTFMAAYEPTDELVFTSGAAIRRGWETTRDRYRDRYGSGTQTMGTLEFELLDIQSLGPDGAIVLGRWKLTDTREAGDGVFSLGLHRGPLGWRILHDHTSATPKSPDGPS